MKRLQVFEEIEFEVEHPLYLARIQQIPTGETVKVRLNEFEVKSVPTFGVCILYLPKYDRVSMTGGAITTDDQAYRVLYETRIVVGFGHTHQHLMDLTRKAQHLAEANPDPAQWKEYTD